MKRFRGVPDKNETRSRLHAMLRLQGTESLILALKYYTVQETSLLTNVNTRRTTLRPMNAGVACRICLLEHVKKEVVD